MELKRSRRRWLRVAGLTIIACVLGLHAWGTIAGFQQRLATAAEHAALGACVIEERVQRVLDGGGLLDLARIEPVMAELAGNSGWAALLSDSGEIVATYPAQASAAWLAKALTGRQLQMPMSTLSLERDDGSTYIVHYQPVAGWPLVAVVAVSRAEIVRGWWPSFTASAIFALLVAAGIAALNERLIREVRHRQASEGRFRDFAESTSDWLWEMGPELRFTYVSPHAEAHGGGSAADDLGKTRRETQPLVSEALLTAHEDDLAQRRPFRNFTYARIDASGKRRHISVSGRPYFDETGGFQGYRGTGRDITAEIEAWDIAARAQSKLDQQRHLLQAIIDTVPASISVKDRELRYLLVNEALKSRMLLLSKEPGGQILGRRATQVFGDAFGSRDEAIDRRVLETGKPVPFHEIHAADHDGTDRAYLTTRLPLRLDDSGALSILSVAIDVTEQRQAESRLKDAIEAINAGFAMFDPSDRLVAWNRRYADLWAASADAAIPDGRERIQRLLRRGILFEELVRGLADAGAHRASGATDPEAWVDGRIAAHETPGSPTELRIENSWIRVSNHRTEDGGYVTLMTDITQLKQRGAELAAQGSLLRATLESLGEGVAVVDFSGRFLAWNRQYVQLTGLPVTFSGGTLADAIAEQARAGEIDPDTVASTLEGWRRAIATREPVHVERKREDGTHVELLGLPVAGIGHVIVVRDVTKERRTMLQLQEARDRAESSNRAKSAFLANMSHELRTPLNAILGFSEVMEQQLLGPIGNSRYVTYATDIRWSGNHLLQLINDVLDLSKIEAGRADLTEEVLDVPSLARDCIRLLDERAREAGVLWREVIPIRLPAIKADARGVRQILLNLLTNAVKFTPAGGTVTIEAAQEKDGELALTVADTGTGIPESEIVHIFEPFRYRSNALVSRVKEGTGLGLSICKRLIEMHGGTIELRSRVDRGTTVTIRFPRNRVVEPVSS
ncbi:MAG: PAS domain S-box protein [Alphaproteobacteria bacterium]|nr:PAS domain S-box protein [Alphaproteobacteria bacterium]